MDRKEKLELMDKLELEYPKKITASRAEKKIIDHLEDEGLPEDIELSDDEMSWLEEQGFSFDAEEEEGEEEEGEEEEGDWDEDEEEEKPAKKTKSKGKEKSKSKGKEKSKEKPAKESDKPKAKSKGKGGSKCAAIEATILKVVKKKPATRKEIVAAVLEAMPDANKNTIGVRISRAKSKDTTPFDGKVLVEGDDKKLSLK